MRRVVFGLLGSLLMLSMLALPASSAQDATPADPFAELDLPTFDVTVTPDGYEGIPASLEAGRYLVSVTASEETGEFGGGVDFVLPPEGMTPDAFLQALAGPPDAGGPGAAAATPIADAVEATPAAGGGPPAVLFDAHYAGGAFTGAGETVQVVLDLPPGEWLAWAADPAAPQAPVIFTVTGEMAADLPQPESTATLTMGEYTIEVSEGALTSGRQVIRVDNIGAQPHFIFGALGPEGMTEDQVATALEEEMQAQMTGTPAVYSGIDPNTDIEATFVTGTQSNGVTTWVAVDLPPGTYGLLCFFPDIAEGIPHAFLGMYTVVEVGE